MWYGTIHQTVAKIELCSNFNFSMNQEKSFLASLIATCSPHTILSHFWPFLLFLMITPSFLTPKNLCRTCFFSDSRQLKIHHTMIVLIFLKKRTSLLSGSWSGHLIGTLVICKVLAAALLIPTSFWNRLWYFSLTGAETSSSPLPSRPFLHFTERPTTSSSTSSEVTPSTQNSWGSTHPKSLCTMDAQDNCGNWVTAQMLKKSKHKTVEDLKKQLSAGQSNVQKLWKLKEREKKFWKEGLGEKEVGWCSIHRDFCDVDSPCKPCDPIPASSARGRLTIRYQE